MATQRQKTVRSFAWVYLLVCLAPSSSSGGSSEDIKTVSAIKSVNACYDQCKSSYKALYNVALAPLGLEKFVASQKCDAVVAANYTCNAIAVVHLCYRECDSMAAQYFVTYSPTEEYDVVEQLYWKYCSVDEMNCRAMDSYYCQVSYNFRLCDLNLARYIQCVKDVQAARGCTVSSGFNCFPSQLVVQALIFTSTKYCGMAPITDLVAKNSGDPHYAVLQACESVIDYMCLGYLGNAGSGISVSFQSNASCDAFLQAIACIKSTVNSTMSIGSAQYVAPCRLLPDAERTLLNLSERLRSMMPASCSGQKPCLAQQRNLSEAHVEAPLPLQSSYCLGGRGGNDSDSGLTGGDDAKQSSDSEPYSSPSPANDILYTTIASGVRQTLQAATAGGSSRNSEALTLLKMSSFKVVACCLFVAVIASYCNPNLVEI